LKKDQGRFKDNFDRLKDTGRVADIWTPFLETEW